MSNPYDEGLACEHDFLVGPPCSDPAAWITPTGRALCEQHFGEWEQTSPDAVRTWLVKARRIAA